MSEVGKRLGFDAPDFRDLPQVLLQCGKAVVREITRCVLDRQQPDGMPQKANAASTIAKKGHDHPVAEKQFRFAKESTYKLEARDQDSLVIGIRSATDGEIAAHLEEKGYHFFGVTDAADKEVYDILDTYLTKTVDECFEGVKGTRL